MKALVFTEDLHNTYQSYKDPVCVAGESLIAVKAAGICGSDMHAWHGHDARRRPPLILGHEVAGEVLEGSFEGQRVTMNPFITCGHCTYCQAGRDNLCSQRTMIGMTRPGGFAQYLTIPDACIVPLPDTVSFSKASLTEPVAVCLHAVAMARRFNHLCPFHQQKHLIVGGGAIGILCALLLQHFGVKDLTLLEVNNKRLATAKKAIQGQVINPLQSDVDEKAYHCVFDAVGTAKTRQTACDSVMDAGLVVHLGLQEAEGGISARRLTLGEIYFAGAFTYTMDEFKQALALLAEADLGDFCWIEEHPLAEGDACFRAIHEGQANAAKMILLPESS